MITILFSILGKGQHKWTKNIVSTVFYMLLITVFDSRNKRRANHNTGTLWHHNVSALWLALKEGVSHYSMPILDSQNVEMAAESQEENVEDEFGLQRHQRPPASVFPGVADKRKHWLVSDILEKLAFWQTVRRTTVKH